MCTQHGAALRRGAGREQREQGPESVSERSWGNRRWALVAWVSNVSSKRKGSMSATQ